MLDIKNIIPKIRQKAVYVTKDNIREFLKLAFPDEFKLDTLFVDESESPYIYASVRYRDCYITASKQYENFILNTWYVTDKRDESAWYDDEYFEENYDIEEDDNNELQQETH